MVWDCISSKSVENLVNEPTFVIEKILKTNFKQSAEKMGIKDTFKLYQDNDPKHKAYKVRTW